MLLVVYPDFHNATATASELKDQYSDSLKVTELQEIVVNSGKQKYSKRNNPAFDLMVNIRERMDKYNPEKTPEYNYDYYDKLILGVNEYDIQAITKRNQYRFIKDYVDTCITPAFPVMLLSFREKGGTRLFSRNPRFDKNIIKARRAVGIDEAFDQQNLNVIFDDLLREVDIYNNDINLLQNRFVSPLSNIAGDYYKYFLNDTVIAPDGKKYIELVFTPKTPESFGFNGRMFVEAGDTTYFIKRLSMRVPRVINLNYIDNIFIDQEFEKDSLGNRHKVNEDMCLELKLMPGTPTFFGRRISTRKNFNYKTPFGYEQYIRSLGNIFVYPDADKLSGELWDSFRPIPLSPVEKNMGSFLATLRKNPVFYWGEQVLKVLVNGYIPTWSPSKFDIGPVNTLISYNSIEGVRLRLGGVTTAALSKHIFGRGYLAYGCRDRKFKYNAELEWSLTPKKLHAREFPMNLFRFHYTYNLDMVGQKYLFTNPDNIFLSLKRKQSKLALYKRETGIDYELELLNNFSFKVGLEHAVYEPSPWLPFRTMSGDNIDKLRIGELHVTLRYAPGEKFYQERSRRDPVNLDAPIFMMTHRYAPKYFLGSTFTVNLTELSVFKRFWFSAFGYADFLLKGGKIWSQVPYPELLWPNANLSYTIQPESYSLMNPMEFPLDYYGSLDVTYWMNGLLFNRIPYFKKLRFREVISYKMLMGGLTRKNNPEFNKNLFEFPVDAGVSRMTSTPYMELSAGIDNILTILRVDYVWRLSYLDTPGISKGGVRVSLHFSF